MSGNAQSYNSSTVVTTNANNANTANTVAYPFLTGLRDLGLTAIIRNGRVGIVSLNGMPAEIHPHVLQVARNNAGAIRAEVERLAAAEAADRANDESLSFEVKRWWHESICPPHDMDIVSQVVYALFDCCAKAGFHYCQYWDGDPAKKPADDKRPYCYIRDVLLNGHWQYWPILADVDGQDVLWVEAVELQAKHRPESDELTWDGGKL